MPDYPHHLRGFDYIGFYRYFLTFCTFERQRLFESAACVDLTWRQFLRASNETDVVVIAYCFMPDHVHLLVAGISECASMKRFVTRAKQYSGFYVRRETGRPLWQRFGYERVLRNEEGSEAVAQYIINNPLRAGLARNVLGYPFWGSQVYSRTELLVYVQRAG